MDPAFAQVLSALITGGFAVLVAWIGVRDRRRRNGKSDDDSEER